MRGNISQLRLIVSMQRSEMDEAVLRLAEWMGLGTQVVTVPNALCSFEELTQTSRNHQMCIALSADTLTQMSESFEASVALPQVFAGPSVPCLVYGFRRSPDHIAVLKRLGGGNINGLEHLQERPHRFWFSTEDTACLQQLTGLDFTDEASIACDVFDVTPLPTGEFVPLLFAEGRPVFLRTEAGPFKDLFLWATTEIADVRTPISRETAPECFYRSLLPAMIFLKSCFGSSCWHNPNLRARLIIDDPPLHPQYGFLRYDALLESMQRVPYATSIAFIPWNYRRSRKAVADLFLASKNRLSLCVHGCDHTNREFDSDDEHQLTQKASQALQRMHHHHESSGVPHEKIMVFPQGHFSVSAIRALRKSGFLAAVNSSCYPSHSGEDLTLGDLMLPAMCHFHGFPIFPRRDPTRVFDIAVDLFLGKAGLVVEHHEFVRDGYSKWEQFAAQMNSLDERLSWTSLIDTLTASCLQKVAGVDRIDVRFFTHTFKWQNHFERPVTVHLSKFEPEPTLIREIRVNGQAWPFHINEGIIYLDIAVAAKALISVEILDKETEPLLPFRTNMGHIVRAGLRRYLSEFRDNTLARNPKLLGYAKSIARRLRLTGDSRGSGSPNSEC
jgi:hypothetical protein